MRRGIVIFLQVLLVIVLIVGGFVGYTFYQGYQLVNSIDQVGLEKDFRAIMGGDCSGLDEFENNVENSKEELVGACKNPALKWAIHKIMDDNICDEIDSKSDEFLQNVRIRC